MLTELTDRIFDENREVFENHMTKNKISKEDAISNLMTFIFRLRTPLYLSNDEREKFQIKEVDNYLPVKLGLYERLDKNLSPDMYIEQCTIYPTQKGKEILSEYERLKSN